MQYWQETLTSNLRKVMGFWSAAAGWMVAAGWAAAEDGLPLLPISSLLRLLLRPFCTGSSAGMRLSTRAMAAVAAAVVAAEAGR